MVEQGPPPSNEPIRRELSPEAQAFVDKAKKAARRTFILGMLKPNSPHSPETQRVMGQMWREIRSANDMTIDEVAGKVKMDGDTLVLFESGLIDPRDLEESFIDSLGQALNAPYATEAYKALFGINPKKEGEEHKPGPKV